MAKYTKNVLNAIWTRNFGVRASTLTIWLPKAFLLLKKSYLNIQAFSLVSSGISQHQVNSFHCPRNLQFFPMSHGGLTSLSFKALPKCQWCFVKIRKRKLSYLNKISKHSKSSTNSSQTMFSPHCSLYNVLSYDLSTYDWRGQCGITWVTLFQTNRCIIRPGPRDATQCSSWLGHYCPMDIKKLVTSCAS